MTIPEKEERKAKLMRFCALQMKTVHTQFRQHLHNLDGDEDLDMVIEKMPERLKAWWSDEPLDSKDYDSMYSLYDELVPDESICCKRTIAS